MSECDKLRDRLSDYVDGELSAGLKEELEIHLQVCTDCQETLHRYRAVCYSLKTLPSITTSPDFERQLHLRIQRMSQQNSWYPRDWKIPAAAFVALFVIVVGSLYYFNFFEPGIGMPQSQKSNVTPLLTPSQVSTENETPMETVASEEKAASETDALT
ncbi:MAG: hypothetical protein D6748_11580, partial [Calditrichaeota bacterium]